MSAPAARRSVLRWFYTNNPFYAVSTVLLLISIRAAYGKIIIGEINMWLMLAVMAGYTSLLAVIAVAIVRWGKVWEDTRSILLLILPLFLAVSICADQLFVELSGTGADLSLMIAGYLFSAVVSELVLRGAGIRFGWWYRVPYHLMLALFYVTPWICAHPVEVLSKRTLEWVLFLFPTAAGAIFLMLIPAIRKGPTYADNNGTPWKWPWFPWTAFGMIAAVVCLRSYVLCLTFSPTGPMWNSRKGSLSIVLDTIWGPYFLIPFIAVLFVLLLEMGLVAKNQRLVNRVMSLSPALLLPALPMSGGWPFRTFLHQFVATAGSPIWLTICLLLAFYAWAWIRRVPGAAGGCVGMLAALSVVQPQTISMHTLTDPQAAPFLIIGAVMLAQGLYRRSSFLCTSAVVSATFGLWLILPQTALAEYRFLTSYHVLWFSVVLFGLTFRDPFARVLQFVGAAQVPLAAILLMTHTAAVDIPLSWQVAHVGIVTASAVAIAYLFRSRWYLYASLLTIAAGGYAFAAVGFRNAVSSLGATAVAAFTWSLGTLLLAFLISAHKANWLPRGMIPLWWFGNGNGGPGIGEAQPPDDPTASDPPRSPTESN